MSSRRTPALRFDVESLEGRGLLSVLVSTSADRGDSTGGLRATAGVVGADASREGNRTSTGRAETTDSAHAARPNAGASSASHAVGGVVGSHRSGASTVAARELLDPLVEPARPDPPPTDENAEAGSEAAGLGEASGSESSIAAPSVGWGPAGPSSSPSAATDLIDRSAGRARTSSSPGVSTGVGTGDARVVWTIVPVVADTEADPGVAGKDAGAEDRKPASARLLDVAPVADWDAIDREMRQLLGGIGRLAETPEMRRAGRAWTFWIGAATALSLARRATIARGPFFRRAAASGRRRPVVMPVPITDGPWPLGPP